ncbi:MAG: agmatinase family protein [Chloroflexota bacterium]
MDMVDDAQPNTPTLALLGLPFDANASFLRGAALAPGRIREALFCGAMNLGCEDGLDLSQRADWLDAGDVGAFTEIEAEARRRLALGQRLLALGGDHSVTYPLLRAYGPAFPGLTLLHLDAHPDLYDTFDGNPYSHASPFARIMEAGLVKRLVQAGIRTLTPPLRRQAQRFGVEVIEMRDWHPGCLPPLDGPLYLSLDLDALDPAFAPGVSHHEPGGFSTRDVLSIIQGLPGPLVGADIVELNPTRDPLGMTAALAAKLCKEISARMLAWG